MGCSCLQVLLGAARLVPTAKYFPIRLRLVRAINRVAQVWAFFDHALKP